MWSLSLFKGNNKNTRTTSLTMFTHCSDVLIVDFQQVNGSWLGDLQANYLTSDASHVQL